MEKLKKLFGRSSERLDVPDHMKDFIQLGSPEDGKVKQSSFEVRDGNRIVKERKTVFMYWTSNLYDCMLLNSVVLNSLIGNRLEDCRCRLKLLSDEPCIMSATQCVMSAAPHFLMAATHIMFAVIFNSENTVFSKKCSKNGQV